ncbi:TadE/TadG family type IV pilus assembly protein [Ovoidimarina sediminis]|uniref:TadE/TadG family type IV pilus assembly protein n=1 Tax=Ovoidimarina sediminis TaxID=3079856 RepID=UPI00291051D9|nr:pilus assembly protein [Rhodophyticola sp. MJ-SS7]MDU8946029.1 pilus assembly protein [Rhodophyticola sp. MJ-SS7]
MIGVLAHIRNRANRFAQEEDGTTLVEFALAIIIFLLLFLGSLDFGRFLLHYYHAERAMHIATRIAVVRPAVCPIPPDHFARAPDVSLPTPQFGTNCSDPSSPCRVEPPVTCTAGTIDPKSLGYQTAQEIWDIVGAAFPPGTQIDDIEFTYAYDSNLGFLGGPYTPQVTVELTGARFRFLTPLGRFSQLVGATPNTTLDGFSDEGFAFPVMGVTMPGEDLNLGTGG